MLSDLRTCVDVVVCMMVVMDVVDVIDLLLDLIVVCCNAVFGWV